MRTPERAPAPAHKKRDGREKQYKCPVSVPLPFLSSLFPTPSSHPEAHSLRPRKCHRFTRTHTPLFPRGSACVRVSA